MGDVLRRNEPGSALMPIYTYKCKSCGKTFDRHHGFDEQVTDLCDCGSDLRRVFNPGGVSFRGNGFYKTDSQTNKPKEDA